MLSRIFHYRYFSLAALVALTVLVSCDGGDDPDPTPDASLSAKQERAQALVGTWESSDNGIDVPDDTEDGPRQELEAITMTFGVNNNTDLAPGSFSASGADTYFNAGSNATWAWANVTDSTNVSDVTLNTVAPVAAFTISSFNGNTMTITFDFEGASTGRLAGIGEYTVQMTKQQ
ncbi:MAG: hypothetical protein ACFB15_17600 [Cyclobacteriaceae bacterium]